MTRDWRKYLLETDERSDDLPGVKRSTHAGKPARDYDFVKKIEKITGRTLQNQKSEPKKKIKNN